MIHTFKGHTRSATTVIHIPDTKYIISGSHDKTLIIWNYETYEHINTL
jgi:WD40 repeat protein